MRIRVLLFILLCAAVSGSARAEGVSAAGGSGIFAGAVAGGLALAPLATGGTAPAAPEISGADMGGLVLLVGGITMLRGRRKQVQN